MLFYGEEMLLEWLKNIRQAAKWYILKMNSLSFTGGYIQIR